MKARLILAVAALAFFSCKKEKSEESPFKGKTCDYAPYSDGAVFSYNIVNGSTDTLRYSEKVTGDSMINGEAWRVLLNTDSGEELLFRCGNGDYETQSDFSDLIGQPLDPVRLMYLRESVTRGNFWMQNVEIDIPFIGQLNVIFTHTVMQKGSPKDVFGQRFENVTGIRTEISIPPMVPPRTAFTIYYAKGVGLIQAETETDTTYITSYNIP